jgi:flagellar assembly protein FliH
MGNFQKFLFDTSFDSEKVRAEKARAAAEAEAAETPPPPTFSEDELEAARQSAYAEGRAAGLAEAEEAQNRYLADVVAALPDRLEQLGTDIAAQEDERRRGALEAAVTVVRKLFPQLAREGGLEEIRAVIEGCLERLRDEPRLVIRTADQDLDALRDRIEAGTAHAGFAGKLVFLADETIARGDVRVEWADGGAERDQAGLWQEIDAVIARALTPSQDAAAAPDRSDRSERAKAAQEPAPARAASPSPPQAAAEIEPLRRAQSA